MEIIMKKNLQILFAALISLSLFSCKHESSDSAPVYDIWESTSSYINTFNGSPIPCTFLTRLQFNEDNSFKAAFYYSEPALSFISYFKGTYSKDSKNITFNFTHFNIDNSDTWYELSSGMRSLVKTFPQSVFSLIYNMYIFPSDTYPYSLENNILKIENLPLLIVDSAYGTFTKKTLPSITITPPTPVLINVPDYLCDGWTTTIKNTDVRLFLDKATQTILLGFNYSENSTQKYKYFSGIYYTTSKNIIIALELVDDKIPFGEETYIQSHEDDLTFFASYLGPNTPMIDLDLYSGDNDCFVFNYDYTTPGTLTLTNISDTTKQPITLTAYPGWTSITDIAFTQE